MERLNELLPYLLPAYLVVFLAVAFFGRAYLVWRRTGTNPAAMGQGNGAHELVGRLFQLVFALAVAIVFFHAFAEDLYRYLSPIAWLERPAAVLAGLALLALALPWIVAAQVQMGSSWRVGIDAEARTELVDSGLFKISRNPIFLGMQAVLLGLFLVLPNAFSLLACGVGITLIQVQVRLEEEYLTRVHGDGYLAYRRRVRRWI